MRQKLRPDAVVLWISDDIQHRRLPYLLKRLQKRGVQIRFRKDVGPHTKLHYALQEYPQACIVVCDDDCLYPEHWLEELYSFHLKMPAVIAAHHVRVMKTDESGKTAPYWDWPHVETGDFVSSFFYFPLGSGGVLYPPKSLSETTFDQKLFRELCAKQDDIWYKAMALLSDVPCAKVPSRYSSPFRMIVGSQKISLWRENLKLNDAALIKVFSHFGLWDKLKKAD